MFDKIKEWIDLLIKYIRAVNGERKKITWPTQQELKASTIVVIITLMIITSFMWVSEQIVDKIFTKLTQLI